MSADLLKRPKAVWAVAFACVVALMGIGLVDPILPVLVEDLDASPSQVTMLFTSYFAVTGVAMLVTGFVASRLGSRRTLLAAAPRAVLDAHVGHLTRRGIAARGALLQAVGDHEDTARAVPDRVTAAGADVVLLGPARHGRHSLTRSLSGRDEIEVIVVGPEEGAAAA